VAGGLMRPTHHHKRREDWDSFHHWLGRSTLFLSLLNIIFGAYLLNDRGTDPADEGWSTWGVVVVCVIEMVFMLLMITYNSFPKVIIQWAAPSSSTKSRDHAIRSFSGYLDTEHAESRDAAELEKQQDDEEEEEEEEESEESEMQEIQQEEEVVREEQHALSFRQRDHVL